MKNYPKKKRSQNANIRVPEHHTQSVMTAVSSLEPSFKAEYLHDQYLLKYVSKDTAPSEVRRQRAINKWLATERNNEATNDRLMTVSGEFNILPRITYDSFMDTARRFIADVIGTVPPYDALFGGFSGGATTSRRRTEGHPALKYLGKADVTPRTIAIILDVIRESPLWHTAFWTESLEGGEHPSGLDKLRLVEGNDLFTVPKNHEIDRCACKEPDLNMYVQRGLGQAIGQRLRRVGIDLNDQSRNQALARQGSVTGGLATLDLSSASDSIARELVFQLIPECWFTLLDSSRSPVTVIDGDVHVNEMFSSMGNGFTFELESLLFYCLSRAVCYHLGISGTVSVYGDDIIVPTAAAEPLTYVLSFLGFSINTEKSFWTGSFRESCGGHYMNGYDVTPFYLRAPITRLSDLIHAANSVRRWSDFKNGLDTLDPSLEDLWRSLTSDVPKEFWGGHDCGFKGQLVSYEQPNRAKRLIPFKGKGVCNGAGGYLLWHDVKRKSSYVPPIMVSERHVDPYKSACRAKKAKTHPMYGGPGPLFLSEI